jgi:DtxR family transcriptional regulator, Mn-dependent transcriptional regulator
MHYTQTVQDYLKAIYQLQQHEAPVSNSRLASYFAVSAPAVTDMVKKLESQNLVDYQIREGVRLTLAGEKIALEMIRHHRLLELYLVQALGMTWDEVHAEAEVLEHVLSEQLEDRIARFLGYPEFDPHGAPIPNRDGTLPSRVTRSLAALAAGDVARIAEVDDSDSERLRYIADLGLVPGVLVRLVQRAPFDGPLTLRIGEPPVEQVIDVHLAARIQVHR